MQGTAPRSTTFLPGKRPIQLPHALALPQPKHRHGSPCQGSPPPLEGAHILSVTPGNLIQAFLFSTAEAAL